MSKFLTGMKLSKKIQDICRSDNVHCIVAFWGDGAKKYLFGETGSQDAQIICDLSMGGTNPAELKKMGAPESEKIRHLQGLHSKVYMSDAGIVITSANASKNALRFGSAQTGHLEAGVFHKKNSEVFKQSEKWFSEIWKSAKQVETKDLEDAEAAWNSRKWARNTAHPTPESNGEMTLFQMVLKQPESFNGIEFLFSRAVADRETVKAGLKERFKVESSPARIEKSMKGAFDEWELQIEKWPERFICVYRSSNNKISLGVYSRGFVISELDIHFANAAGWRKLGAFPELKNIHKGHSESEINDFVAVNDEFCDFYGNIINAFDLKKKLKNCGFPSGR